MQYFFSRRTLNRSEDRFKWGRSTATRYVAVPDGATARSAHVISKADWLNQVRTAANGGPIVVFVHGFNTLQKDMRARMRLIDQGLRNAGFPCTVVGFDWPSDGNIPGYWLDRNDAKKVAPSLLVDGLSELASFQDEDDLHLIAHSMGAYLTLRAYSDQGSAAGRVAVNQSAFVAADIDKVWMHSGAWGERVMAHWSNRLTNYYSSLDQVLNLQEDFISGRERAGYSGMPSNTNDQFEDVYCGAQYQSKVPDSEKGLTRSHTWYWEDEGFYRDLCMTFEGRAARPRPTRGTVQGVPEDVALITPD